VKFKAGAQATTMQAVHQQARGSVVRTIPRIDVQVIRLAPGTSASAALDAYRASPAVEYAEQNAYRYFSATPNDQYYGEQWHYPAINLPMAWDTTKGGAVIVAVLDSGIRSHPDLNGITVQGMDFFATPDDSDPTDPGCAADPTDFSHGMHVTGTIAALTNNVTGVAGVNWGGAAGTKIMPIRVGGEDPNPPHDCGIVDVAAAASGIIYAADHGAKVINMSFSGASGSVAEQNAVNYAHGLGVTLVAAVGNENGPVGFPAAYSNVIAVGATDCANNKASYSNTGPELDVVAPGGDATDCTGDSVAEWVLSTSWSPATGNGYWFAAGTSMASPHVAGLAALIISRGPLGPAAIQSRLESTATDLGANGKDNQYGSGLVNAAAAVGGGSGASRLCVFTGQMSGSTITRQSDMVRAADTGAFSVTNAQSGFRSVFAWQDFDGNGTVTPGDAYGQRDNVAIYPNQTTSGVSVTVQTRQAGSTVLSVPGGISCP
jgi:serine protease